MTLASLELLSKREEIKRQKTRVSSLQVTWLKNASDWWEALVFKKYYFT